GTNEINRLLIPGILLTRAMKGEIPLQREAMKAFESLMTPSFEELDESVPFAAEKALIASLKQAFLVIAGTGAQKFMAKMKDEQEVLLAIADVAINIFAIESCVLRAEKMLPRLSDAKRGSLTAAVKAFTFTATEKTASAARKAAYYIEEGDTLAMMLSGIRRFTKYDATGLLQAKRRLADAASEAEKYIF
ncbi:MAG TPA: acyl-CoA dehydrogenase, partial [Geomonas sp.]